MSRRNNGGGKRLPSPKKRKPIRRHPNPFVQSDIEDAERTLKWLRKEDMSRELQWIDKDKGIPTAWYAAETLAKQNGITCGKKRAFQSTFNGRWYAFVIAHKGNGKYARAQVGASSWDDRRTAICFAYRNAIRGLLPMQPNTNPQPPTYKKTNFTSIDEALNKQI